MTRCEKVLPLASFAICLHFFITVCIKDSLIHVKVYDCVQGQIPFLWQDEFHRNLKHDRPFTLSMANAGPCWLGSDRPAPDACASFWLILHHRLGHYHLHHALHCSIMHHYYELLSLSP